MQTVVSKHRKSHKENYIVVHFITRSELNFKKLNVSWCSVGKIKYF